MGQFESFVKWWKEQNFQQEQKQEFSKRYISMMKASQELERKIQDQKGNPSTPEEQEKLNQLKEELKTLKAELRNPKDLINKWIQEGKEGLKNG